MAKEPKEPWMSTAQMSWMYNTAKDRRRQIKILAELNETTEEIICRILGIELPKKRRGNIGLVTDRGSRASKQQIKEMCRLYYEGESYHSIAEAFGMSYHAVYNNIQRYAYSGYGDKKRTKKEAACGGGTP